MTFIKLKFKILEAAGCELDSSAMFGFSGPLSWLGSDHCYCSLDYCLAPSQFSPFFSPSVRKLLQVSLQGDLVGSSNDGHV